MLSGDNSILQKATDAKERTDEAQIKERIQLAYHSALTGGQGSYTKNTLMNELENEFETDYDVDDSDNENWKMKAHGQVITIPAGLKNDEVTKYAPYDNPYIPVNFSHIEGTTWNAGFTIKGNTGTANAGDEFVWVPCVLDQTKVKPSDTVQTLQKHFDGKYAGPTNDTSNYSDEGATAGMIRTSVEKYGGFYIAKYEAGKENGNERPLSQAEKSVWNNISRADAITTSSLMIQSITGIKSTLISAECWDTTLQWIKNTIDSTYDEDSTGKGYYSVMKHNGTSDFEVKRTDPTNTGYYGINNIFDMAGNCREYTTENLNLYNMNFVIGRGGDYSSEGCASDRHGNPNGPANEYTGFRVVIYKE